MNPVEIIIKKRDGSKLTRSELEFFIHGFVDDRISEYQMSAFLMAVYFQGMDFEETTDLTDLTTPLRPRLITVSQAALLAGVSESSLRRMISRNRTQGSGDLAACLVSAPGGQLMIRRGAFESWLDADAE